jgi:hypothetical protein
MTLLTTEELIALLPDRRPEIGETLRADVARDRLTLGALRRVRS